LGRYCLFVVLLAIGLAEPAHAQGRVLIVRDNSPVAQQTAEVLTSQLAGSAWTVSDSLAIVDGAIPSHSESERVIVALGGKAFTSALSHSAGKFIIGALLPSSTLDELTTSGGERWSAILLDQPIDRWIALLQIAFPNVQQIGILTSPINQKMIRVLEKRITEKRLTLLIEQIAGPEDVVSAIEKLTPRIGVLLAIPDPLAHNRNTAQPLLLTTYRAGIPVVAYSESYQQAGAVLALYSTVPQIATQVVDSLNQIRDGRPLPNVQVPRYFSVGVNIAVARSLGISLPPAREIDRRLHSAAQ
jgi:putative tryptophan/tyrosine transport system substrate-binding protein